MVKLMRGIKVLTIGLLSILLLSISALAATPVAAQMHASDTNVPQVTAIGNYTKIVTDAYTVIFPNNGGEPQFVWWANNQSDKVYVAQFKGLIEYAQIDNNSSFLLKNAAESTLFVTLVQEMNMIDSMKAQAYQKAGAALVKADDAITTAGILVNLGLGNRTTVMIKLQAALTILQDIKQYANDTNVSNALDLAITKVDDAINAVNTGNNPDDAIAQANNQVGNVLKAGLNAATQLIDDRIAQRENLMDLAASFHPALLPFNSCAWSLSGITPINDNSGSSIGITFTFTMINAPPKFDLSDNNVKLVIRIYAQPVTESYSESGQTLSYSVAGGEMKMDLIISNWNWNFAPKTIQLLNSSSITISPGLALWVDASAFNATGTRFEAFFDNMTDINATLAANTASFTANGGGASIPLTGNSADASQLTYKPILTNNNLAGKILKMASLNKITLNTNSTLEGFFRFVPFAMVNSNGVVTIVPVGAAYIENGNHLRLFITYPYFNGTLTHDPSIGVGNVGAASSPLYLVNIGSNGVTSVQALPASLLFSTLTAVGMTSVIVLAGAVALIVLVRRRPAIA
jgi:hypothetical protein